MAAFRHASQGVTVRNFWLCCTQEHDAISPASVLNPKSDKAQRFAIVSSTTKMCIKNQVF